MARIMYFIALWGSDYYGTPIDAGFAWALAGAMADHSDELSNWDEV